MTRPRLPIEVKKAKGTINVTRERDRFEMTIDNRIVTIPACPDFFNEYQASEWQTVWNYLIQYKLAAPVDFSLIISYCLEMGKYLELNNTIGGNYTVINPKGYEIENPLNSIANKALMNALKIGSEFGFTPVSRSRIVVPKKEAAPDANDITSLIDG